MSLSTVTKFFFIRSIDKFHDINSTNTLLKMYRTQYNTLYRVHTVEEAIQYDIARSPTDLFLYLIDTYDVLLSVAANQLPMPSVHKTIQLRAKLSSHLLEHYHDMYKPIPGALYGFTESMLMWIVLLTVIDIQHWESNMELNPRLTKWAKTNRVRMFPDPDMTTWNLDTLIGQLDCLSMRWHDLDPCEELQDFLEIMWRFAARFTLRMHSKDVLNVENYLEDVPNTTKVRLSADGMMIFLSRYYWFNHLITMRVKWMPIKDASMFPSIADTNWETFIGNEKRHFVTRRFRDGISDWMWNKLLNIGDQEIASHDQLGDEVSAFTCMYARFPAGLVSRWQKILTYDDYEDIVKCKAIASFAMVHMLQAHFSSVYNVDFLKYFFIYDKIMHRHLTAISKASTPIIIYWYKKFMCYFEGKVYEHPDGTEIPHAFIMWVVLLRKRCDGKCYSSMDFTVLCEQLLDKAEVVNNDRSIAGFFDLDDD